MLNRYCLPSQREQPRNGDPILNRHSQPIVYGLALLGCGIAAVGAAIVTGIALLASGAALIPIGTQCIFWQRLVWVIQATHGPSRIMFDRGYEMGRGEGFWDDIPGAVATLQRQGRTTDLRTHRVFFWR